MSGHENEKECVCSGRFERPLGLPTRTIKEMFACEDLEKDEDGNVTDLRDFFLRISPRPDTGETVESFVTVDRAGMCKPALMSAIHRLVSKALQWGIPASEIARSMCGIQCKAATAGNPLSCIDWMGTEIAKKDQRIIKKIAEGGRCIGGMRMQEEEDAERT